MAEQTHDTPTLREAVETTHVEVEAGAGAPTHAGAHHHDDDTTTIRFAGREVVLPVPLYTAVFGALAILTIVEVLIAELIESDLKAPVLVLLSLGKAGLVVWFYMHLNRDSRLFLVALALPVIVALISVLYLMAVPQGYSY